MRTPADPGFWLHVQVCAPDGLNVVDKTDCSSKGQRCRAGACVSLVCQPNQRFCDQTGVRQCNAEGSASFPVQNCSPNQYCDPKALVCKQGICEPGQPACNGTIATTCNANGSGYQGVGVDCGLQLDRQCVLGACLCSPNTADCDGDPKNGCEAAVTTDPDNCGGCGFACSSTHIAKPTCDKVCDGTCSPGFDDCDDDKLTNGCEVTLGTDAKNCGACGTACSNNHVTPSCSQGSCNGACTDKFADCNQNKQKDGCESDPRTDAKNCGGCGVVCSTNHVKAVCAAALCSGDCAKNFADCNGDKQTDGCEVNTLTDAKNCGGCGSPCPDGQSCASGKCSALFTFSGVAQNLPIASLVGWTPCFAETYGTSSTPVATVQRACQGSQLLMACRAKGSSTLQLAAEAPRADVMFDTNTGNTPHNANKVGWYFNAGTDSSSWGFAPQGDAINRFTCDIVDSSLQKNPGDVDGDKRLCWHTQANVLQGGWRCGRNDNLNADDTYERLMFSAP